LLDRHLDASDVVMMAHAESTVAKPADVALRFRDLRELLDRDRVAVGKAGGEAGRRGFVPGREGKPE
jgi:hypothetical protein